MRCCVFKPGIYGIQLLTRVQNTALQQQSTAAASSWQYHLLTIQLGFCHFTAPAVSGYAL